MRHIRLLERTLHHWGSPERYLFAPSDLAAAVPDCPNLNVLLSRAVTAGILQRVCRGIYLYPVKDYPAHLLLFHAAARLRSAHFNYISLETALSDAGIISQIPMGRVTLMSSGRSHVIDCGNLGSLEFVHTNQKPNQLAAELTFDSECHLWRASPRLALRDLKATRRSQDLISEGGLNAII
jgi:hypothetical protein